MDSGLSCYSNAILAVIYPFILVCVDGHRHVFLKFLQVDNRDTTQYEYADRQIQAVIGDKQGLLDYDPFEGMIGHLLGVRRTMPLDHKTLLQRHLTLMKSRVIRIDVLQK